VPQSKQQKRENALARLERDLVEAKEMGNETRVFNIEMNIRDIKRKIGTTSTKFVPFEGGIKKYSINDYLTDIQSFEEN
jgi:hypothetical protein